MREREQNQQNPGFSLYYSTKHCFDILVTHEKVRSNVNFSSLKSNADMKRQIYISTQFMVYIEHAVVTVHRS